MFGPAATPATVEDRWILSRLERARTETAERIERFDFSHAALGLYDFVYGELCDWYLELVKPRLRAGELALQATLLHVLTQTLALAHPMIPFVTEEIYRYVPGSEGLLAAGLPEAPSAPVDEAAEASVGRVIEAVQALRGWRDFAGVKAGGHLAGPPGRRGLRGDRRAPGAAGPAGLHIRRGATGREPCRSRAGRSRSCPRTTSTSRAPSAAWPPGAPGSRPRSSGPSRSSANQGFVAKAPPEVVQAERDKLERLPRGA